MVTTWKDNRLQIRLTVLGANLKMPEDLGIPETGPHAARNQWLVGVVNA
jgi:hypothetical protein